MEAGSGRQSRQKTDSQGTRLAEAITDGRLYQTKTILADVTNINYLDHKGLSPLMRAFMIDDSKHRTRSAMVKLLLHHNADVNLRDRHGLHVFNLACKMNKLDLVKLVFERCLQDVDLTSQDLEGNTPLIHAIINNNVPMVKLLVSALRKFSLSVDHRNIHDKTAYLKALEMGFQDCASILSKVGKASREIKVNPFLDFLAHPTEESTRKIRVRSAPLTKEYSTAGQEWNTSKQFKVKREKQCVNDSLFDKNRVNFSRNKKRGNRVFKSRKIHSVVSQNDQDENYQKTETKTWLKRGKTAKPNFQNLKIVVQHELDSSSEEVFAKSIRKKNLATISNEETNSGVEKKDQFLRLLLDESQSTSGQQSPRNSLSSNSCNQVVRSQCGSANGYFPDYQHYLKNNESRQKQFPNYHSYLVWKASLDHPPNTLRSMLALRAEQHSESYRKGIVIPKYDPTSEESVNDRDGGAISPVSERSGKSEAARKISAVAKTVGLSIYLTNKRKTSSRKES